MAVRVAPQGLRRGARGKLQRLGGIQVRTQPHQGGELMFGIIAVVSFAISLLMYAFSLGHSVFTWTLFMLIGFLAMALSGVSTRG